MNLTSDTTLEEMWTHLLAMLRAEPDGGPAPRCTPFHRWYFLSGAYTVLTLLATDTDDLAREIRLERLTAEIQSLLHRAAPGWQR